MIVQCECLIMRSMTWSLSKDVILEFDVNGNPGLRDSLMILARKI